MQTFDGFSAFERTGDAKHEEAQVPLLIPAGREGTMPTVKRRRRCRIDPAPGISVLDKMYADQAVSRAVDMELADEVYGRSVSPEDAMIALIDMKSAAKRRKCANRRQRLH